MVARQQTRGDTQYDFLVAHEIFVNIFIDARFYLYFMLIWQLSWRLSSTFVQTLSIYRSIQMLSGKLFHVCPSVSFNWIINGRFDVHFCIVSLHKTNWIDNILNIKILVKWLSWEIESNWHPLNEFVPRQSFDELSLQCIRADDDPHCWKCQKMYACLKVSLKNIA